MFCTFLFCLSLPEITGTGIINRILTIFVLQILDWWYNNHVLVTNEIVRYNASKEAQEMEVGFSPAFCENYRFSLVVLSPFIFFFSQSL